MQRARKRFGQHFLHDNQVIDKILRAISVKTGDHFLEIGPGRGALTFPLLRECQKLTAIELDRDLIETLQRSARNHGELNLINADILNFELNSLPQPRYRIVGNLPYNISTPLMFHLLNSIERIEDMHFMVQKEVAQRLVANVDGQHYGRLSIMVQYYCDCDYLFDVPPGCFTPPPRVDSAIIRMRPLPQPGYDVGDKALFDNLVQTAFGQRRKTISNSLKSIVPATLFTECNIDKGLRAENLSAEAFAQLSFALTKSVTP